MIKTLLECVPEEKEETISCEYDGVDQCSGYKAALSDTKRNLEGVEVDVGEIEKIIQEVREEYNIRYYADKFAKAIALSMDKILKRKELKTKEEGNG